MIKCRTRQLANGAQVLLMPQVDTQALTLLVVCKVGSRYESPAVNGVSHFIEHLMFKGTKKRPHTLDLSHALDSVGAEFNAFTAKDHTGYYIKVSKKHLVLALDLLSDMLFNSLFAAEEINRERGVICEEINMYKDNPLMYCDSLLEELAFGAQHPLGQLISGPKKVIQEITRDQILKYRDQFYDPSNLTIALAGNYSVEAYNLIKKYFNYPSRIRRIPNYIGFKSIQKKPQVKVLFKQTEQVQLGLSFPAVPYQHADLPAFSLLSVILGANMSSRLFTQIRERLGLCYFIRSEVSVYQDAGLLVVQSGLDKDRIQPAITAILKEIKNLATSGVTAIELQKAKDYLQGRIDLSFEDSAEIAAWYTLQNTLSQTLETPAQKMQKLNKVTTTQIKKIAQKYLQLKYLNLALIGPFKDPNPFIKLLK